MNKTLRKAESFDYILRHSGNYPEVIKNIISGGTSLYINPKYLNISYNSKKFRIRNSSELKLSIESLNSKNLIIDGKRSKISPILEPNKELTIKLKKRLRIKSDIPNKTWLKKVQITAADKKGWMLLSEVKIKGNAVDNVIDLMFLHQNKDKIYEATKDFRVVTITENNQKVEHLILPKNFSKILKELVKNQNDPGSQNTPISKQSVCIDAGLIKNYKKSNQVSRYYDIVSNTPNKRKIRDELIQEHNNTHINLKHYIKVKQ